MSAGSQRRDRAHGASADYAEQQLDVGCLARDCVPFDRTGEEADRGRKRLVRRGNIFGDLVVGASDDRVAPLDHTRLHFFTG